MGWALCILSIDVCGESWKISEMNAFDVIHQGM